MKQALNKIVVLFLNSAERKQFRNYNILNQSDWFILIWPRVGVDVRWQTNTPEILPTAEKLYQMNLFYL